MSLSERETRNGKGIVRQVSRTETDYDPEKMKELTGSVEDRRCPDPYPDDLPGLLDEGPLCDHDEPGAKDGPPREGEGDAQGGAV